MTGQVPGNILAQLAEHIHTQFNIWGENSTDYRNFQEMTTTAIAQFLVENHLKIVER